MFTSGFRYSESDFDTKAENLQPVPVDQEEGQDFNVEETYWSDSLHVKDEDGLGGELKCRMMQPGDDPDIRQRSGRW